MKKSFIHQQEEISFVKNTFTQYLKDKLEVIEVQGPILSKVGDGMQDNLSGIEHPVSVKVLQIPDETYEVVHSSLSLCGPVGLGKSYSKRTAQSCLS